MVCTAMSKAGLDSTETCQSPVMRLTLITGSFGSLKVARPSRTELEPDDCVIDGLASPRSIERGATALLESLHPYINAPAATAANIVVVTRAVFEPNNFMRPPE